LDSPHPQAAAKRFASNTEYSNERFTRVQFKQARLANTEFYECVFSHCNLRESLFDACKFNDCTFEDCDMSLVRFEASSFSETRFVRSQVVGVNWTLAAWSKFQTDAPIAFEACAIDYAAFIGLTLRKLEVRKCSAQEVEFSEAELSSADFRDTDLAKSRFRHTNLTKADFTGARNYVIDLMTCKVSKAKFAMPEALGLLYGLDIDLVE
jgi:fluoroquinolone resistance protein